MYLISRALRPAPAALSTGPGASCNESLQVSGASQSGYLGTRESNSEDSLDLKDQRDVGQGIPTLDVSSGRFRSDAEVLIFEDVAEHVAQRAHNFGHPAMSV
jgi:hypothetical protein